MLHFRAFPEGERRNGENPIKGIDTKNVVIWREMCNEYSEYI